MNNDKMSWSAQMHDARYLRAQAELCLEMARQVSDRASSEKLRAEAARYHAEATEIETGVKTWELKGPTGAELNFSIEAVDVCFRSIERTKLLPNGMSALPPIAALKPLSSVGAVTCMRPRRRENQISY